MLRAYPVDYCATGGYACLEFPLLTAIANEADHA